MLLLQKYDVDDSLSTATINGRKHSILEKFGFCAGKCERSQDAMSLTAEQSLTQNAQQQFPDANAVIVTVVRGNEIANGRAVRIELEDNTGAVS